MKTLFQKTMLGLFVLTILYFVSCGDIKNALSEGIDFTNAEEIKALSEIIEKHITADMKVHDINFAYSASSSSFSLSKDQATLTYVDPDNISKLVGIDIDLKTGEATPNTFYERKIILSHMKYTGTNIKGFDYTILTKAIQKASELLIAEDASETTDGLGTVRITFEENIEKSKINMELQHKTGTEVVGKRINTLYNQWEFKSDIQGNVEFVD